MKTKIFESTYKDQKAVTLENHAIKAQFLPELGGKMASFFDKVTGREFLVQAPGMTYRVLEYDGSYVDAECSGFDDMFPTIDPCYYERDPWAGIKVPDHGEVCGLRWQYEIREDELLLSTYGVRFPYRLEKRVRFLHEQALHMDYLLTNLSDFAMDFIWAAHPMINAEADAELLLPFPEDSTITCVFSTDSGFGRYGEPMKWPLAIRQDTKQQALNRMQPRNTQGNNYKFYFNSKIPAGWFKYRYNSDQTVLTLLFPEVRVPYFSIWVNEGSFHGHYSIAPEPCTGAFDRIDRAAAHGMNSTVRARETYPWFLTFEVGRV
jgi:hypothetical protein